ncbi:hypothetical protein HK096_008943 [Nowakowskiella sp. JEL0078]|nr:hypothetical protein HK096_008943 [Nowakowskiella sp. JEL0078]
MVHMHSHRYNILSVNVKAGESVPGEPYSGYKDGRRAARTPGYNIITGFDPLIHLTKEELKMLGVDASLVHQL